MSLRKRGPVWWIDFVAPDGERVRDLLKPATKPKRKSCTIS